jgi:polyisoprenoid-binding protein YceI
VVQVNENSIQAASTSKSQKVKASVESPEPSMISEFTVVPELSVVTLRISNSILGRFDVVSKNSLSGRIVLDESGKTLVAKDLQFTASTLDSGIGLRDGHIKSRYLEVEKFPLILMPSAETKISDQAVTAYNPVTGTLIVKGVPKKITGQSKLFLKDETLRGTVEFQSKISDFPIERPTYMGLSVKDEFSVQVDLVGRPDIQDDGAAESGL